MKGNGDNYNVRLTRIEDIVEALAIGQRQLLTSQILLTDQLEKTNRSVEALAGRLDQLTVRVDQLAVRVDQVEGQVEALVKIVDGMIRGRNQ